MRAVSAFILPLAIIVSVANGQIERKYNGQGYVFAAPGVMSPGSTTTMHFGGGFEAFAYRGLGLGAEIGYLCPVESMRDGIGMFSPNASYHLVNPQSGRKVIPFVTGGHTLAFREGRANLVNFGGGANIWLGRRVGLRLEVRDHVWRSADVPLVHYLGFRTGLALR